MTMKLFNSCIYEGHVAHKRSRPRVHQLRYRVFCLSLDIDELDQLHRRLKWFSVNSFNILSFYDRDHGPGTNEPLRPWIEHHLRQADVDLEGGSIKIVCYPRVFGYAFNPLTTYFCYHQDGTLRAMLYEVSNTFGQRHSYLFPVKTQSSKLFKHSCEKRFYVSPFLKVSGQYHFTVRSLTDQLFLHIRQSDSDGPTLDAWTTGKKKHLTDRNIFSSLLRYPLLTLKIIAGIHLEALKLWAKGVSTTERPNAPNMPVTIINDRLI
jgi:DUF1365 family protein